jgi:NAD(P)-dependent dehydrogenase (short-subunit alcohol dehydrogenase family)
MEFDGRTGIVTGAGSGIGRASSLALAAAGAYVAVADVDEAAGRATAALITDAGGHADFFPCDVSRLGDVDHVVASVVASHGRLDFAHNNAGVSSLGHSVASLPEEEWQRVIGINLTGVWRSLKAQLPVMRSQGHGSIVNTASICAFQVAALTSPYNTAKHAVIGLTKEAAVEFAQSGIRVNAVCPGYVHTAMSHGATTPADREAMRGAVPMGRWGEPEEIADAVMWLLSDASSYVTGHSLVVDGGTIQAMTSRAPVVHLDESD